MEELKVRERNREGADQVVQKQEMGVRV